MANAYRQSTVGGSGSGGDNVTTSAKGYTENTLSNSLLRCVVRASYSDGPGGGITINSPATTGFTWTLVQSAFYLDLTIEPEEHSYGYVQIYDIVGASAMSTSVTTTVTATAASSASLEVSFNLYEFTGVATSSAQDTSAGSSGDDSTPNAGTLTTSYTDLIFVAATAASGIGSGFTEGLSTNEQYILNQTSGSIATSFSGTLDSYWACSAAATKAAVQASSTLAYGFIIG